MKYGPYPKEQNCYYAYEVYRNHGKIKQRYLGRKCLEDESQ